MKAWVGEREGKRLSYALAEIPDPLHGPHEVLIRVHAVGLNLVDRFPKRRHFEHTPAAPAAIPGLEAAGEIAAVGDAVPGWRVGERVMAMVQGGAAPLVRAHHSLLMSVPAGMTWAEAAAVPVSFLTAHNALMTQGAFSSGNSVLVQGATTGAGLAAIQMARRRNASWIGGSSRSAEKLERMRALGLDFPVVVPDEQLADKVLAATAGRGVDVVVDHLGAGVLNQTLRCTALGGRVVNVGRFSGARGEIDLELLALRRISLIGVTFRTRALEEHAAIVAAFMRDHAADLASGALRPVIDQVFDFARLPEAIERAQRSAQLGKLVLALDAR